MWALKEVLDTIGVDSKLAMWMALYRAVIAATG